MLSVLLICVGYVAGESSDAGALQAQIMELTEIAKKLEDGERLNEEILKKTFSLVRQEAGLLGQGKLNFIDSLRQEVCGPVEFLEENLVGSCRIPGIEACEGKWINATMTEQFWLVPCTINDGSCQPHMQCSEVYAEWRDLSDCSVDCGLGIKRQVRNCLDRNGNIKNDGVCADVLERTVPCIATCPGEETAEVGNPDGNTEQGLVALSPEEGVEARIAREKVNSALVLFQDLVGFYRTQTAGDLHLVVCAQGQECGMRARCAVPDQKFAVRCCSDSPRSGWIQNGGCPVWTLAKPEGVSGEEFACNNRERIDEASAICHSNGGRLCTQQEVSSGCLSDSACGYDSQLIWTATVCPELAEDFILRRLISMQ